MKKTKIICTLGPATDDDQVLANMIKAGMDVARFNFSHGDYDAQSKRLEQLIRVREAQGVPVATLLDTKGPEIRTGDFEDPNGVVIHKGDTFTLTTKKCLGDAKHCYVNYPGLVEDVKVGTSILINDGLIAMEVTELRRDEIVCRVTDGGLLTNKKGVNVPDISLNMPYLSPADMQDLEFGASHDFDFIAASFVRTAGDVIYLRNFCQALGWNDVRIIAKIENMEGVNNIDAIIEEADGIMVARGDMGVEIPFERIPAIQKMIIRKVYSAGKVVVTATQMLESMITNPRPTRAEITDVANAICDGTSAIMLSGETAAGKYPVEAVKTMDAIARRTEENVCCEPPLRKRKKEKLSITAAVAHAACTTALDVGADAILTVSQRGLTAQMVSRFRPATTVVALLLDPQVRRQMALYWGVEPIMMPYVNSTDELVSRAVESAEAAGLVKRGDLVVVTAGVPVGVSGTTNMIRIQQVGGALLNAVGVGSRRASGPLCVCLTPDQVAEKFRPGDVLVLPYTTNELLPYIRKAAAVITEESSADCHTATVGLTLDKPVIVGAAGATHRLTDGTMVTVDCVRGLVCTMP